MLFEKPKKRLALASIGPPLFLKNKARNSQTEFIDIRYLRAFRKSSAGTVESLIGAADGISDAAHSKKALQFLVQKKVAPTCFLRIVRRKKLQ